MIDFTNISDHVINIKVAKITGESAPRIQEWGIDRAIPDYCNDARWSFPLIQEYGICLGYDGISWEASCPLRDIPTYRDWVNHPEHPLRLAMIVFLMIHGEEK